MKKNLNISALIIILSIGNNYPFKRLLYKIIISQRHLKTNLRENKLIILKSKINSLKKESYIKNKANQFTSSFNNLETQKK